MDESLSTSTHGSLPGSPASLSSSTDLDVYRLSPEGVADATSTASTSSATVLSTAATSPVHTLHSRQQTPKGESEDVANAQTLTLGEIDAVAAASESRAPERRRMFGGKKANTNSGQRFAAAGTDEAPSRQTSVCNHQTVSTAEVTYRRRLGKFAMVAAASPTKTIKRLHQRLSQRPKEHARIFGVLVIRCWRTQLLSWKSSVCGRAVLCCRRMRGSGKNSDVRLMDSWGPALPFKVETKQQVQSATLSAARLTVVIALTSKVQCETLLGRGKQGATIGSEVKHDVQIANVMAGNDNSDNVGAALAFTAHQSLSSGKCGVGATVVEDIKEYFAAINGLRLYPQFEKLAQLAPSAKSSGKARSPRDTRLHERLLELAHPLHAALSDKFPLLTPIKKLHADKHSLEKRWDALECENVDKTKCLREKETSSVKSLFASFFCAQESKDDKRKRPVDNDPLPPQAAPRGFSSTAANSADVVSTASPPDQPFCLFFVRTTCSRAVCYRTTFSTCWPGSHISGNPATKSPVTTKSPVAVSKMKRSAST